MILFRRTDWGASAKSPGAYADLSKGIIVHWNGPGLGSYTESQVANIVAGTYSFHVNTNGWADIAYNFSIDRFGRIWEGRGKNVRNAASGDNYANGNYTAVELLFGVGDPFTDAMKQGLVEFYKSFVAEGGTPKILGHRDVTPTQCPGDEVLNFLQQVPTLAAMSYPPAPPTTIQKDSIVPDYILFTADGSVLPVFKDGSIRSDYTWDELNALMTQLKVPAVKIPSNIKPSRIVNS